MKKFALLVFIFVFSTNLSISQKKSSSSKSSASLASVDNLTVDKKDDMIVVTLNAKSAVESIVLSDQKVANAPQDVKIKSFTADNTKLYLINWTEITTSKTELKTEEITTIYSKVIHPENKAILFSNYQKSNHITEKVFLDRFKNASETQEKMRREGFEFILNADGSITQKNKTQENKWVYSAKDIKFVDAKKK
jgi:CRISPR/Cas system CMR subunit Cmr4 (Cas7 group RAMP superfamily)